MAVCQTFFMKNKFWEKATLVKNEEFISDKLKLANTRNNFFSKKEN